MRDSPRAHDENIWHMPFKHPGRSTLLRRIQHEDLHARKLGGELLKRLRLSRHGKHLYALSRGRGYNGAPQTPTASDDNHVLVVEA
jgi:hypothetical protein